MAEQATNTGKKRLGNNKKIANAGILVARIGQSKP
jgi:hypothetical protein